MDSSDFENAIKFETLCKERIDEVFFDSVILQSLKDVVISMYQEQLFTKDTVNVLMANGLAKSLCSGILKAFRGDRFNWKLWVKTDKIQLYFNDQEMKSDKMCIELLNIPLSSLRKKV